MTTRARSRAIDASSGLPGLGFSLCSYQCMDLCQRCPKRPEAKFVQAVLVSLAARCPIFHATNHERIFYEGVRSEVQVRRRGGRVMSTAAGLEGAWSTRLEREAREDGRRRRGEHLPPESAVRIFVGVAAGAALDLAARERVAAVLRAHALVVLPARRRRVCVLTFGGSRDHDVWFRSTARCLFTSRRNASARHCS